ncbi:MAG: hypothetical protein GKR90_19835 [Pseudomonadales bacterium]|nr:hypothetical protein [Pseudomonadales bacterium]
MNKLGVLVLMIGFLISPGVAADTHPEVAWSLGYSVPEHKCVKPRMRKSNTEGQTDRFQRKVARFANCVKKYQTGLIADHQRILASAEHGLTKGQAEQLVGSLKSIEQSLVSLGEDFVVEQDYSDLQRVLVMGNRSSI